MVMRALNRHASDVEANLELRLRALISAVETGLLDRIIALESRQPPTPMPGFVPLKVAVNSARGYSDASLRLWIKKGQLDAMKDGGRVFVSSASLADCLAARVAVIRVERSRRES